MMRDGKNFHLHLVSDATGETLQAAARAACAQYESLQPVEHLHVLIRTSQKLTDTLERIDSLPGIVMFTMVDRDLRLLLEKHCHEKGTPCLSLLDPLIDLLGRYSGEESTHKPGSQYVMDADYFRRIAALDYAIAHDDGQMTESLKEADVILVGLSRTTKTPTCIYLAYRGLKAANVPLIPDVPLPAGLTELTRPLIIALTVAPGRLVEIRRNRLLSLNEQQITSYVDSSAVAAETREMQQLYTRHGWPMIDVTRRSVEEVAAAILALYSRHRHG